MTIVNKGEYNSETTYSILNVVRADGGTYISKINNNLGNSLTDTNSWLLLTEGIKKITEVVNSLTHTYTISFTSGASYQFEINDGYTPIKGVDYFTNEDIKELNIPTKTSELDNDSNLATTNQNNNFSVGQTINGTLTVNGNIVQNGESYETQAEVVKTKNDYIKLREGATGGLGDKEYTGFESEKYDGTNNGRLVFDNTGTARVGDKGDEQPLATREESLNMSDGEVVIWDGQNSKMKTGNTNDIVRNVLPLTSGEIPEVLVANTEYYVGEQATVNLTFPTEGQLGQYCFICFTSGVTATVLTITGDNVVGDTDLLPISNMTYELLATFNGSKWVLQYIAY